jgi:nucleotide-binding universal stress UspA family protein
MKKILIPTDFSPAARYALDYAEWFSLTYPASLVALHVISDQMTDPEKLEENQRQLKKFTTNYPHQDDEQLLAVGSIKHLIRKGKIVDQIVKTAVEEGVDMIILGTRAKHHIWEYFIGSVATDLVQHSPVPVMVIPEGSDFEPIEEIAFATKIDLKEETAFAWLQNFSKEIKASISQVYVNVFPSDFNDKKEEEWKTYRGDEKINTVTMVREKTVSNGLQYYLQEHPAQILALYLPNRNVLRRFLRGNFTRQIVYNTKVPILLFRE